MKKEKGIALIALIVLILVIGVIIFIGIKYASEYISNEKKTDTKATMLSIQSVATNKRNRHTVDKENNPLVGTKLDIENSGDYVISPDFKEALLSVENAEMYILNQEDLTEMGLKNIETNNENFFVVDYNTEEIFYSQGIDGKYKLSEM